VFGLQISEKMRMQLLKEEFKLRKKQPQSWTAQKYRKYANIGVKKKKEKPEFIEEERDLEARLMQTHHKKEKKKAKALAKKRQVRKAKKPKRVRKKR
jgi:hypothetical protein